MILKIVKHLTLTDYHSILRIKQSSDEKINILLWRILVFIIHGKIPKCYIRIIILKYHLRHAVKNWITQRIIFYIRYSRSFWINIKKHGEKTVNPSIKIYINKTENRITFKTKTGYYFELSTLETMKLLGGTNSKITKNENS